MKYLTIFLVFCGLLVPPLLLIWKIYRDLTNRGKLKVECYLDHEVVIVLSEILQSKKLLLFYNITNIGRKPITVIDIGGINKDKRGRFSLCSKQLPKKLEHGDYIKEKASDLSVLSDNLKYLWAIDSSGKEFKVKKSVLKNLINDMKKFKKNYVLKKEGSKEEYYYKK